MGVFQRWLADRSENLAGRPQLNMAARSYSWGLGWSKEQNKGETHTCSCWILCLFFLQSWGSNLRLDTNIFKELHHQPVGVLYVAAITCMHQTPDSLAFQHRVTPVTLQGTSRPSAVDCGYIFGPSCIEVTSFWSVAIFPCSVASR
jgi:hypothetical protein